MRTLGDRGGKRARVAFQIVAVLLGLDVGLDRTLHVNSGDVRIVSGIVHEGLVSSKSSIWMT